MSIKDRLSQRVEDLKSCPKEKHGALVEAKAAELVLRDLILAAEIASEVARTAAVDTVMEPGMDDVMSIHQLYQAYLGPAYQTLLSTGEIPQPPVPTTPSSVKTKEDLVS